MLDANTNGKGQSNEIDPETLTKLLEVELKQKRAQWKQAEARNRSRRVNSAIFLVMLIGACAVAFFFMFSKVNEQRANHSALPSTASQSPVP